MKVRASSSRSFPERAISMGVSSRVTRVSGLAVGTSLRGLTVKLIRVGVESSSLSLAIKERESVPKKFSLGV